MWMPRAAGSRPGEREGGLLHRGRYRARCAQDAVIALLSPNVRSLSTNVRPREPVLSRNVRPRPV